MASSAESDITKIDLNQDNQIPVFQRSTSNNPMSFYEALVDRYLNAHEYQVPSFVHFQIPPIDYESDGCKLGKLRTLVLDKKNIYKAGIPDGGLSKLCPNITLIHLSRNPLKSWSVIESILREFPLLEECNLHRTCFTISPEDLSAISPTIICPKLHTLNLAHTNIGWSEIQHIALQCPNLRDLELVGNSLESISTKALDCLPNIECLNLSLNKIHSWEEVTKLGKLPKLEILHLSNNPISFQNYCTHPSIACNTTSVETIPTEIEFQQQDSTNNETVEPPQIPLFPSLLTLSLAEVNLCKWQELDILAALPVLKNIRLKDLPLASDISQEDRRKIFLSWFPNIVKLNGSTSDVNERIKSERFTLRYFYSLEYKPLFLPRLIKKYGDLKPLIDIDLSFGYKEIIEVEFMYKSKLWRREKITVKQTVKDLIFWLKKELNVPKNSFTVYHLPESADRNSFTDMVELYMSSLPLSRFDIHEGDQIIIT
ncbi:Tubulin-specific chaperone cofactor E-like protein [Oopsacas minuta]|uniref:Tubulin-specific chaperone cofactor E-like protein n=1 Tax=Oopsacas minuta TaxID=111878 RepID=A0AAV7JWX8_9METZ|nr:Tubulin-specific chaperone cofactor E-like protein [Oopsacas minuta]